MNNEQILEDNKLIAEFMGWKIITIPVHMLGEDSWFSSGSTRTYCCKVGKEQFHESWDWLMPVIEKIKLHEYVEDIVIQQKGWDNRNMKRTFINISGIGNQIDIEAETSLIATHRAVVKFIKWYNRKKIK